MRVCPRGHKIVGENRVDSYSFRNGKRFKYDKCRICRNAQANEAGKRMRARRGPLAAKVVRVGRRPAPSPLAQLASKAVAQAFARLGR